MVYLEFGKILHEALVLTLSFAIIYSAIGLWFTACTLYLACESKEGVRRFISSGREIPKYLFPLLFAIFFFAVTFGWPFVVRHGRRRKQAEELQEKERLEKAKELHFK